MAYFCVGHFWADYFCANHTTWHGLPTCRILGGPLLGGLLMCGRRLADYLWANYFWEIYFRQALVCATPSYHIAIALSASHKGPGALVARGSSLVLSCSPLLPRGTSLGIGAGGGVGEGVGYHRPVSNAANAF